MKKDKRGGDFIRILHTADWHIGHELLGWTRVAEQTRVLREIAALAVDFEVDALIVAGDIFDHQNPSSAMYKMLYEFFDRLAREAPDLTSVIISGNHDSAGRLEAPKLLLKRANVEAIGSVQLVDRALDLKRHLIPVGQGDDPCGFVLAIPYLRPADLPGLSLAPSDDSRSPLVEAVQKFYRKAITASRDLIGDKPLVVTGHLHVKGATLSESLSERHIVLGGEHAVPSQLFGSKADYVALGHLHRAQSLGTRSGEKDRVRYAGSPLPLSVTERCYEHGVSLVDVEKSSCSLRHMKLLRQVPFLRVPDVGRLQFDEVEEALKKLELDDTLPREEWPFVQLALEIEAPQPGLRAKLDELFANFPLRDVAPDIKWPGQKKRRSSSKLLKRLGEHSPQEMFIDAFKEHYGFEPEKRHIDCFRQLLDEA